MSTPRPIFERLEAADRVHQRELGGRRALGSVKWWLLALVLAFAADLLLQLGAAARLTLLVALILSALALLGWSAWLAWVRRNPPEHIARLLEDRDPSLGSKLINLLQLRSQATDTRLAPLTQSLARQAVEGYGRELAGVPLEDLAGTRVLRREWRNAGLAVLAFALLLAAVHPVSRVELARFADPFGDHPPYSFTRLAIVEPGPAGTNVLYGKSFLVKVKSDGHRPKDLFLTVHPPDHPERAVTVPMLDKGPAGFHQVVDDIRTEVVAYAHTKDRHSLSPRVRLGVILVPQLERAFVEVSPPAYTGLKPQEKPYTFKNVEALDGSRVKFRLQSNRPLRAGSLEVFNASGGTNRIELARAGTNEVAGVFEPRESGRLRFQLTDVAGIASQAAWEGQLTVLHDLPPEIRIAEPTRDSFVSLDFKVTAQFEASDDYGLSQIRIHRALNGVYSAPKVVRYNTDGNVVRSTREAVDFDFRQLGVQPGDVVSFFAEAIDTSPAAQMARTATLHLTVIGVEDYNEFLRERSDIASLQGKYDELANQFHDLVAEQKQLAEAAARAKDDLAKVEKSGDAKAREAQQRQLDALLAKQSELNARLNQQAARMEKFVRDQPMYDIEQEFGETLKRLAETIRQSTATNNAATRDIAQRSSPADGSRNVTPGMLGEFQKAAEAQASRLGGGEQQAREAIEEPLRDLARLQELMKDFNQFEALFQAQQALADQARAYNRPGPLSREDQLALRDLANTERQVADLLERLEDKLRTDADAAQKEFPKAADSGRALAKKMDELRLEKLARDATRNLLEGQGEASYQSAERLRSEMARLFSECQSSGGRPGREELDRHLSLSRSKGQGQGQGQGGMKAGNTFAQMFKSRKFGKPGGKPGSGPNNGPGEGEAGESGYAVGNQQPVDVLGNESFAQQGTGGQQEARAGGGSGPGKSTAGADGLVLDRPDVLKGLKPVNRKSAAVQSESLLEEYSDVVDSYFKAVSK